MTQLSNRLETLAILVTPGNRLVDVGTDHGFVPIALCERGRIPSALAMDINQGPLDRAREHVRKAGLEEKIQTRLSNGMDELKAGEADTLLIAGMGGLLIVDILERGRALLPGFSELILSPHSEIQAVRKAVYKYGFLIREEKFLREEGKYYTIMRCIPAEEAEIPALCEEELYYGPCLLREQHPVLKEALKKEAQVAVDLIGKLSAAKSEGAQKRVEELRQDAERIERALRYYQ